jgi:ATP-dependent Clp protease ATP-binding subunit ClpC
VGVLGARRFPGLHAWLTERVGRDVDVRQLREFGAYLTGEAEAGELPRAHGAGGVVETLRDLLSGEGARCAVLVGESGTGKTAVVHELVHRLREDPDGAWHVVRVSPSDIMAGTLYAGEWETKVRDLVAAVRAPKRVILYVPNLEGLTQAGIHSRSSRNVGDMLAPHLENGEVAILGESTPEAFRTGLGRNRSLSRLFARVEIQPPTREHTRELLDIVCAEAGAEADPAVLDRLMDLADFYLQGIAQPGRAVGLLRRVLQRQGDKPITPRDILRTLEDSTGMPVDLLDDETPLDLGETREFLERRVMGQPEAVDAVVDLVSLVKAGMTDPGKPYGVLFFIGPTGVGKTELARTLAELLFGDPARLLRFDMSEYATFEAFERLIGRGDQPGLLTNTVREHPFSVVLLDEIEKAHMNVFDLCLQIFDAGRLTDGQGRTTDFRNTIVILTSNVGSQFRTEPQLGFGGADAAAPDRENVERELRRYFRPEFLNRLDRVVHFRPLAAETAERIARREVAKVMERSGIARRRLTLDVDPGVLALLLRRGYSPAFGARPLKRTVERLVLLPVARAVSGGEVPAGSLLRLVERGGTVCIETVRPDETAEPAPPSSLDEVRARVALLRAKADAVAERKSRLLEESSRPGFWDDRPQALSILDTVHRLDRLLQDVRRLEDNVARTARNPDPGRAAEFTARHEDEAGRLEVLLDCRDLGDAFVMVTRVKAQGGGLEGVARLARMYQGFARRRGFEFEVLGDRAGGEPHEDVITLFVGGTGAFALLSGEEGLHQLTQPAADSRKPERRELVRVEVLRAPADESPLPPNEVRVDCKPLREAAGRLIERRAFEVSLLHLPSMVSVHAWCGGTRETAVRSLQPLLRARTQALESAAPAMVRRYVFGPAAMVRDRRTGRSTGKLDRVLRGEIDEFVVPR